MIGVSDYFEALFPGRDLAAVVREWGSPDADGLGAWLDCAERRAVEAGRLTTLLPPLLDYAGVRLTTYRMLLGALPPKRGRPRGPDAPPSGDAHAVTVRVSGAVRQRLADLGGGHPTRGAQQVLAQWAAEQGVTNA